MSDNCVNFFSCGYNRVEGSFYCESCTLIKEKVYKLAKEQGITNYYVIQDLVHKAIDMDGKKRAQKLQEQFMADREARIKAREAKASSIPMDTEELERRQNAD